ncbi:MAG: Coq4 family protein [Myxococcota bacterium]
MPAAPIHWSIPSGSRFWRTGQAITRVLRDSTRTDEIVVAEEILAQRQLRYWVESGVFEYGEGRALFEDRPEICQTSVDDLRALAEGTLGREFARFLDFHGLGLEALDLPAPYTPGEAEAYLMKRLRGCHDIWHTLIGAGTHGHEEVLVHCFSVAQTGLPYSVAIIGLGAIKPMVLEGRWSTLLRDTRRAYRCGRDARSILTAYWERRWDQPLDEVRREFGIVPLQELALPSDTAPRAAA